MNETDNKLSDIEISTFCGQMAMFLKAGMSVDEGFELMLSDTKEDDSRKMLEILNGRFNETGSLSAAVRESGCFPDYLSSMIRIGEETGKLDDVMATMEKHYSREAEIQKSIQNAVIFPMVMIAMITAVILVLLTKVFPLFNQAFLQLGSSMSGISAVLLNLGNAISKYSKVLIFILVCLAALVLFSIFTKKGRKAAAAVLNIFPFVRKMTDSLYLCRFANGMALTLRSGLPPQQSLEFAQQLIEDPVYRKRINAAVQAMDKGADLNESLKEAGIFNGSYARMLLVGARVGNTDEVMEKIADLSEDEFESRVIGFISAIEPVMVVVLSVIVGIILLSVMLPLTGIMGGL